MYNSLISLSRVRNFEKAYSSKRHQVKKPMLKNLTAYIHAVSAQIFAQTIEGMAFPSGAVRC